MADAIIATRDFAMPLTAQVKLVTGRTRHFVHGAEIPAPEYLKIEPDGEGFLLLRYNQAGEELADTWHESIAAAMSQAQYEYEIVEADWTVTDD